MTAILAINITQPFPDGVGGQSRPASRHDGADGGELRFRRNEIPQRRLHAEGGAAGLGLGSSRQKHLFVPEPQNDFIFSILCEELGFVGACAVILLFALLLWRGITLAAHAPDRFGALLVVGFVVQVALQAVLNMAVVTNTIPNTGISLPFFSSGGTSLMMLLGEMGIVLSVSRGET